jgi:hypothetical protein
MTGLTIADFRFTLEEALWSCGSQSLIVNQKSSIATPRFRGWKHDRECQAEADDW